MDTDAPEKSEYYPDLQDEDKLVEKARHDTVAFASLYKRYLTPIYRYLLSRLNNLHDAEDLTAQVFTEALEGLVADRYQNGGNFAAWLFTIARRRLVDFYRQHPTSQLADPPSQEPSLLSIVENNENIQHLSRLLAQLDEEHRELLRLRFSAGLSFSQISLLDGRSEPAVKMAFYRTISFLQKHWESDNG
jgi:RNA polymerase sigma-70 factor (ECF subfamily)